TPSRPVNSSVLANNPPVQKQPLSEPDLPCLSDNDSILTSSPSGSPALSSKQLSHQKYYSPFSTGFDLSVTLQQRHQPKSNLLDLLNPTDHVKTTITPTSFRYFDDMMMSTSLYKTHQEPELDPIMIKIKQDWNSISYCT
ncbi:hypothetical protein A0J61_10558, partial [Choanephora cucurbitarum]